MFTNTLLVWCHSPRQLQYTGKTHTNHSTFCPVFAVLDVCELCVEQFTHAIEAGVPGTSLLPPALSPPTPALTLSLPIVGTDFNLYEHGDLTGDALHAAARSTVDGGDHFPSAASPGPIPGHRGADCQACSTLHLAQRYVTPPPRP